MNDSVYSQKMKILQVYLPRTLRKSVKISQARFRRQTFVSMSLLNLLSSIEFIEFICVDEFISAQFELNHLVTDDVKKSKKTTRSCGLDKIPANILKDCNEIISPYLTNIYNCSISTAIFPKWPGCHQFLKPVPRKIATITGQFPFYQQWPKYLKN